jgi:hypothetical protein
MRRFLLTHICRVQKEDLQVHMEALEKALADLPPAEDLQQKLAAEEAALEEARCRLHRAKVQQQLCFKGASYVPSCRVQISMAQSLREASSSVLCSHSAFQPSWWCCLKI